MDYDKIAGEVLQGIGGMKNIENVTHCATRLRFWLLHSCWCMSGDTESK